MDALNQLAKAKCVRASPATASAAPAPSTVSSPVILHFPIGIRNDSLNTSSGLLNDLGRTAGTPAAETFHARDCARDDLCKTRGASRTWASSSPTVPEFGLEGVGKSLCFLCLARPNQPTVIALHMEAGSAAGRHFWRCAGDWRVLSSLR